MKYTETQKQQIRANIQKIENYIEQNILQHIAYSYDTGAFGPMESWGIYDENYGRRYRIGLNGPYSDKIRFYCKDIPYNADELVENHTDDAIVFLEYWQDAKSYMNTELQNNAAKIKLIETFEI